MDSPPASVALQSLGIPHRVFRHTGPVDSLVQAAAERGQRPEQVVRSLLFRLGEDQYLMALVAGPAQVSWKKLRSHVARSGLTTATEEEVFAVTGYRIGAVSPFGTLRPLPVLVDRSLLAEEELSLGSGIRGVAIVMRTSDLMRALPAAEVVDLIDHERPSGQI